MKKYKRNKYIKLIIVILLFLFVNSDLFAQKSQESRNIKDYFDLLANESDSIRYYKYGFCSWYDEPDCEKIIDIKNGYIATNLNDFGWPPFFQMAMFKDSKNENLIVIHAVDCGDHFACAELEEKSSFLKYKNGKWVDVADKVLPKITLKHFFKDKNDVRILKQFNYHSFRFHPPRIGTTMKVTIEICDYIAYDDVEENAISYEEYERLLKERKTRYLKWNKEIGKFVLTE